MHLFCFSQTEELVLNKFCHPNNYEMGKNIIHAATFPSIRKWAEQSLFSEGRASHQVNQVVISTSVCLEVVLAFPAHGAALLQTENWLEKTRKRSVGLESEDMRAAQSLEEETLVV